MNRLMGSDAMSGSETMVNRNDAVLVLVDMQERLASAMPNREGVERTAVLLAGAARILGIPVIVTRQNPDGLGDTLCGVREAVGPHTPCDKMTFSCFSDPVFAAALAAIDPGQVIIAGMETHICVTQTALDLHRAGFAVHVVADATCARRDADHSVALDRLRAAGVVVTVAESVIYEALGRAGTDEFRQVLALVKEQPIA